MGDQVQQYHKRVEAHRAPFIQNEISLTSSEQNHA